MSEPGDQTHPISEALKASQLREVLHRYGDALKARRRGLDKLNVYPVPDGDTGTNMSLTVQSVVAELRNAVADDMGSISHAISKGATLGARGNSGAILAQVLRGITETTKEKTSLGPEDVALALERARKSAYEAVLKPVEGTILTVVSAAAVAARKSADEGHKLKEQMDHIREASAEALARTPELLPVLKQAGVVDAGGSGFLLFVDALRYVATGEPIPGLTDEQTGESDGPDLSEVEQGEIGDLRYEVMFLLEADDERVPEFRGQWGTAGDSIVVVGGDGTWNCHVHTDDIGAVIEIALDYGRPRQIRVTDLLEQSAEHSVPQAPVETAVVAVVSGKGLTQTYLSMGAQQIVAGGQSANPSVAEMLASVEAAPSQSVVVLPNNKNVHAAANQLDDLTTKHVVVVPTKSPVQGLATLLAYDPTGPVESNFVDMKDAADHVSCGEVTQAVRNATSEAGPVEIGNWLGISADGIVAVTSSVEDALCDLVKALARDEHEILTVVEGDGSSDTTTEALRTWISEHLSHLEMEVHKGGQPLYPYLLGVE